MNRSSLSQNIVNKQQQPSWIDDPFNLKGFVATVRKPMNDKANLSNFAEDLVSQYAKFDGESYTLFAEDLSDSDQNELIRLYIESTNRETNECIYGDDFTINSEFNCALLAMLQCDNKKTREEFARVTRDNLFTYYRESLNDVLSAACCNLMHIEMNESGFRQQQDSEHGDIYWGKF